MKITAINGSPRGLNSTTNIMIEEFLSGAREAGAQTENIILCEKKIHDCLGCFSCWTKTPGKCVVKDDMSELFKKIMISDITVFASPVYVGGVTGIMKNFIDRLLLPATDPHIKMDGDGIVRHVNQHVPPPGMVVISNCGFPSPDCFKYFRSIFSFIDSQGGLKLLTEIYLSEGPLLQVNDPGLSTIIQNYRSLLRKAGGEMVKNQAVSTETQFELEKPLISYDLYIEMGNKYWDEKEHAKINEHA
jgi:hypothetical protein